MSLPNRIEKIGLRKDVVEILERKYFGLYSLNVYKCISGHSGNTYFLQTWKLGEDGVQHVLCSCPSGIFMAPIASSAVCIHGKDLLQRLQRGEL